MIWLSMAVTLVLMSGIPGLFKASLAALIAVAGAGSVRRFVYLRGRHALRALEWPGEEPVYFVHLGGEAGGQRLAAIPDDCRQYGIHWWLLRFRTAEGVRQLLVDTRLQEQQALRSLARRLFRHSGPAEGVAAAVGRTGTDTIRAKV
ncbi:MAG: hypothetical protein K0Q92_875 [Steroidobacteraceae bacterium]|jgi:hypothetical protein|nr:hypothetical protein [Steroidobacteraceae bacterium]